MLALNERYRPKKLDDSRRGTVRPPDAAMIPGFLVAFSPARSSNDRQTVGTNDQAPTVLGGNAARRGGVRNFLWAEGSAAKDESLCLSCVPLRLSNAWRFA